MNLRKIAHICHLPLAAYLANTLYCYYGLRTAFQGAAGYTDVPIAFQYN